MNWLGRLIAALLLRSALRLPVGRREWLAALLAEAEAMPAGREQLAWLAGGARLILREGSLARVMAFRLSFAVAAVATAWSAWPGPDGDYATHINRADVIASIALLAWLPGQVRKLRGPMAGDWLAFIIRTSGYLAVLGLVMVKASVERVAYAPPAALTHLARAWAGEFTFLAVLAGYVMLLLACTTWRSAAARSTLSRSIGAGAGLGIIGYALGPLGFPLRFAGLWPAGLYDLAMAAGLMLAVAAPFLAGQIAVSRTSPFAPAGHRAGLGAMAGLLTGAAAAFVVTVLCTATIALLPHDSGLRTWGAQHIGHWTFLLGHWTPILDQGEPVGYVSGNSAYAAGFVLVLIVAPVAGWVLGACGGLAASRTGHRRWPPGSGDREPVPGPPSPRPRVTT